jgi:3'(2'), 5'-bisphosphate nucleotidase
MAYETELAVAERLARQAGKVIMYQYGRLEKVMMKENNTPVTQADIEANRIIAAGLHEAFPQDGIVSEEIARIEGERTWYIDPLDGTKQFINRLDQFAMHIGLCEEDRPTFGVLYKPATGELYYGGKGIGACREDSFGTVRLEVRETGKLVGVVSHNLDEETERVWREISPESRIRCGSEGLRIMKIAENIAQVHFSDKPYGACTWDECAPQAILEGAGGHLEFLDGSPITYVGQGLLGRRIIAASTREIMERVQETWRRFEETYECVENEGSLKNL